jgi:hypothetical protein
MRYIVVFTMALAILAVSFSDGFSWSREKPVTPYGDFCARCSNYGICKYQISDEEAEKAITEYYQKKGLKIKIEKKHGRFIRAKIKDSRNEIDIIIFDRRTGRIRSIY